MYLTSQTWRAGKTCEVYENFNVTAICTNEIQENKFITSFKIIKAQILQRVASVYEQNMTHLEEIQQFLLGACFAQILVYIKKNIQCVQKAAVHFRYGRVQLNCGDTR